MAKLSRWNLSEENKKLIAFMNEAMTVLVIGMNLKIENESNETMIF
jgi:hypothetical protein